MRGWEISADDDDSDDDGDDDIDEWLTSKMAVADAREVIQSTLKINFKRSEQQKKGEKRANKLDTRRRRMRCCGCCR